MTALFPVLYMAKHEEQQRTAGFPLASEKAGLMQNVSKVSYIHMTYLHDK